MQIRHGIDHVANVTFDPQETVRFYTEVMGADLTHCITAKGWGPRDYPDFAHFFFNIGGHTNLAFFYYFGTDPENTPRIAHHLSLHAPDLETLGEWEQHFRDNDVRVSRTEHESIESIYWKDPNNLQLEMTAPKRALDEKDREDARKSVEALIQVVADDEPDSLERMWQVKGRLVDPDGDTGAAAVYVLDVPEFQPIVETVKGTDIGSIREVGNYLAVETEGDLRIHREDTGLIEAIWFGALTGGLRGTVKQFDNEELVVTP